MRLLSLLLLLLPTISHAANPFAYLDESDPYYVARTFPKLTTPQWVGEDGVEAVVVLAIDDMRDPARYEAFLRPILRRLQQLDGRAPVSIMTCSVKPDDPQLQTWLKEGLSIEVHTFDHPCPFFKLGFPGAKTTYDKCVDLMASIPGNRPVAFRMPCCDSMNTPSPRHWSEIFNQKTAAGKFLSLDSSVFNVLTANDPALPRALVLDEQGRERFRKYLPMDRSFANYIEDYPYPYIIGKQCWQFPCVTPSDWQAQHLQKPKNPQTVADWKAALDAIVIKQGVFNLVFHPHGWIANDQVVDLIDYAVARHGKKVKFLTFREAEERLNKNLLHGHSLRHPALASEHGVRLLDLNGDGYLDVLLGDHTKRATRIWSPTTRTWTTLNSFVLMSSMGQAAGSSHFGSWRGPGKVSWLNANQGGAASALFDGKEWQYDAKGLQGFKLLDVQRYMLDYGVRLRDLDSDGRCELLVSNVKQNEAYRWDDKEQSWLKLPWRLPDGATLVDAEGRDNGVRFLDLDEDGHDDLLFSNEDGYGVYLWKSLAEGWSRRVVAGKLGDKNALPPITLRGRSQGMWALNKHLWWSNENTVALKDHVDRRSFQELLGDQPPAPRSPEASLKALQARPGFTVELMAAEPLVQDPIAFAFGADGKLWVVEMGDYPLGVDGKGQHGGRVKFLEDTKGTGKFDKATVFLDKLGYPTGVLPWGKGVLVTCAPEIFYAEDTDGDGKADVKKALYTGFVEGNQQHRVNTLAYGLDNWIYCANGDSGGTITSVKTGQKVSISGRDFRIKPDEGLIETQTGQTQFGRCRDDWGNWFGGNNSNPLWHFVLDDHYLKRNPHLTPPPTRVTVPAVPGAAPVFPISPLQPRFNSPDAVNRFTSACSPMVYRDDLFGPAFAGSVFISEPVHNLVHREVMTPRGVTFTSKRADDEQTSEFLASSDNWFRPTMIATGPDGALWVADMYRHVLEHPQWIPKEWQAKLDLRAGHDLGRIYRVYPTGAKPRPWANLAKMSTVDLVKALDSPNGWQRDTAQQLLLERKDPRAVPLLINQLSADVQPRALARLHALCTLHGLGALNGKLVSVSLADSEPEVRRHAVRLSEPFLGKDATLVARVTALHSDSDPHVQLQLACTLGEVPGPEAAATLAKLARKHAADPYLSTAVLSSVNATNLDGVLLELLRDEPHKLPPALLSTLMRLALAKDNQQSVPALLAALARPARDGYAAWQYLACAGLLDVLEQQRLSLAVWRQANDTKLRDAVLAVDKLFPAARLLLHDDKAPVPLRAAAIQFAARDATLVVLESERLLSLLSPQTPLDLQLAAAQALTRRNNLRVLATLQRGWNGYGPQVRQLLLDRWLELEETRLALVDALAGKLIPPAELDAARRQQLLTTLFGAARRRAAALLEATTSANRQEVIAKYRAALKLTGDATRGKQVFGKSCTACHQLQGVGNAVGPDLAALQSKSEETLLLAILDPNQAFEVRYTSYLVMLRDGRALTGLLANETSTSITLVGVDGKAQVLLRIDIAELASTGKSQMPEGLEKDVQLQDLADLLAYLRGVQPKQPRKTFNGNTPQTLRPNEKGELILAAKHAEIYGSTVIFEANYGNLGFWGSGDDRASWTVELPKAGKWTVTLDWACADNSAGNRFALRCGQQELTGTVAGTGGWDHYRQLRLGTLELPAGQQRLELGAAGALRNFLFDLRTLRLTAEP